MGQISSVIAVIVNNTQIPVGVNGTNMTATGWYNVISYGTRNGSFNPDFSNSAGQPLGDPYGSMAFMSLVVPNSISNGTSFPEVNVLIQGLQVAQYDSSGNYLSNVFGNNPAWVMLDALFRSGWNAAQLDLATFCGRGTEMQCAGPHGGRQRKQHYDSSLSMQSFVDR